MTDWFHGKEYIYEVHKESSFSKAAKNMYISQPSLSASVKRVEERIGLPLFDRSQTPIGLTAVGKRYIEAVEHMKAAELDFERYAADIGELRTGEITIGGSNLFSSYVLPHLIARFTEMYPLIQIHLVEENTARLFELLMEGTLDLVIDNLEYEEKVLVRHFYQSEHLLLVVPLKYSQTKQLQEYALSEQSIVSGEFLQEAVKSVPLKSFESVPFIFLKPENDTMKRGMMICKKQGLEPRIIMQLDQQMTAYNIACSGMGACFASDILLHYGSPNKDVAYYKLSNKECTRNIYFYHKRGRYVSVAMGKFLELYTHHMV